MYFCSKRIYSPSFPQQEERKSNTDEKDIFSVPKVNTNVLSVNLGSLGQQQAVQAGDFVCCTSCQVIFNFSSKIVDGVWECEFCQRRNEISLEKEEIPTLDTYDYILSPAKTVERSLNESSIIFVLDVSGSMCSTTEVEGKLKLKGDTVASQFQKLGFGGNQYQPNQNRNVTYVSRLQCVQAAVEKQIEVLYKEHPKMKVGLVFFNNEVNIVGDGSEQSVIITGDKLYNFEALIEEGFKYQIKKPISESKDSLIKKLYEIEETGCTALGPAFLVALGMIKNSPASKIVLATDGLANLGVGALDFGVDTELFYEKAGNICKQQGIIANVIGIQGENLNINIIGKLADITQGDTDIVNPLKIVENFSSVVDAKVVATNVVIKLFLHKVFEFPKDENWKEDSESKLECSLYAIRDMGTVFEESEVTAEFVQKDSVEVEKVLAELNSKELEKVPSLPFQVQISYTTLSGMRCLRVITKKREVTRSVEEAQEDIDVAVFGMHANSVQAKLAQQGMLDEAIEHSNNVDTIMRKNVVTEEDRFGYDHYACEQQTYVSRVSDAVEQRKKASPSVTNIEEVRQQQRQILETDDTNSNMILKQRNIKAQKSNWSASRRHG